MVLDFVFNGKKRSKKNRYVITKKVMVTLKISKKFKIFVCSRILFGLNKLATKIN